ncbi:hypothetical protein F2Q69_00050974 [Brassica cretica]|uniref:Uncharacterized protein n=1 Tax=Brassica cretica TaxID=69181 RepID=A0A8S9PNG2_BRACR|nr:hypothetical protein F2Q69_00050974 [Brassica cretica]
MIVIYHILEKYIVTEKVTTTLVLCIFPAVASFPGGGACTSRARRGETSGGACGFVRAPIEAWLVSTASSRREEHDGGLECTR